MASSSSLRLGLRSSNTAKYVKHTTRTKHGERAFSYAGPAACNALPASLHDITDTTNLKKYHLFERAFPATYLFYCFFVTVFFLINVPAHHSASG